MQLGGNRRFREYLEQYNLLQADFHSLYYSKAAEYYRQALKAETMGTQLREEPWGVREGV